MSDARIRWFVSSDLVKEASSYVDMLGRDAYRLVRNGLKEKMRDYVGAQTQCVGKGYGVSPIGSGSEPGSKLLKVRCALPGRGASRSLRLIIEANCENRTMRIVQIMMRRDA